MPDNPGLGFIPARGLVGAPGSDTGLWSQVGSFLASNFGDDVLDWLGIGDDSSSTATPTTTPTNAGMPGCPPTVPVQVTQRAKCPPGYVVVHPAGQGKQCMIKSVARACGLWKPSAKPPIKASDWRCLRKANSVVKKMDRIAKMSNEVTGKAPLRRVRSKR